MVTKSSQYGTHKLRVCRQLKSFALYSSIQSISSHAWVCKKQPLSVNRNATFLVDLSHLPSPNDVFADDMGVWKHTGSPSQFFEVRKNQYGGLKEITSLGKKRPKRMSHGLYRIKKNYSSHHAASDLSRTVIFLEGKYWVSMYRTLTLPLPPSLVDHVQFP